MLLRDELGGLRKKNGPLGHVDTFYVTYTYTFPTVDDYIRSNTTNPGLAIIKILAKHVYECCLSTPLRRWLNVQ